MSSDDDTPPDKIVRLDRPGERMTEDEADAELERIQAVKLPLTVEERLDELEVRCLKLRIDLDNLIEIVRSIRS